MKTCKDGNAFSNGSINSASNGGTTKEIPSTDTNQILDPNNNNDLNRISRDICVHNGTASIPIGIAIPSMESNELDKRNPVFTMKI